jgi:hypothetical protein
MRDIDRVTSSGEPPRRTLEPRPGKRGRRSADSEESSSRTTEEVYASRDDEDRSGTLDLRV